MKHLFIGLITLFFVACSPKYVLKTIYTQPTTQQGIANLQQCNLKRENCQSNCNKRQNNCLIEAKHFAQTSFNSNMHEYHQLMRQYRSNVERYEHRQSSWDKEHLRIQQQFQTYSSLCNTQKNKKSYECRRSFDLNKDLTAQDSTKPKAPSRPDKPTLSREIRDAQRSCSNSCGCQNEYDNCFVSSGGTLDYKKFCIENCK